MNRMKGRRYDLTIIIPHFNMPDELKKLLDSIGSHERVQVIVVDDRSDRYLNELERCKKSYDNVLFLQTEYGKKGAGAARNTGLSQAEGKWLLFADSDDLFLPEWYEVVSSYLESDYDVIYFSPVSRKRDGSASRRHERYARYINNYLSSSYGGEERLRGRFSVPWSKMIRTDLVEKNKILFDEVFYSADVMFSAKIGYYAKKIAADETPIYCIIDHEDSMSRTKSGEVYCRRLVIYCERDRFFKERLSQKKFEAYGGLCFLYSVKDTLKKGYGWKTIHEMRKIYKKYDIPLIIINYRKHIDRIFSQISQKDH